MDLETSRAKMMAQVDAARLSALAKAFAWTLEVDSLTAYVEMRPRRLPDRLYLLRVCFDDFPERAPSYSFVDRVSRQPVESAWPPNVMHSDNGICTPGTREFHERLHKNDAQYPWDHEKYTFLSTLTEIHRLTERGIGG